MAGGRGTRYLLYALFLIVAITYGGYRIAVMLADALTQIFPGLLGRATWYVFLAFLGYFVFGGRSGGLRINPRHLDRARSWILKKAKRKWSENLRRRPRKDSLS